MTCLKHNKPIRAYFHPELHFCCEDCEREKIELMFDDLISSVNSLSSSIKTVTSAIDDLRLHLKIMKEKRSREIEDANALITNIEKKF